MESTLQTKCVKKAKEYGVLAYKIVCVGRRGFPDLLLIFEGGLVVFVELKTPTGRLSAIQKRVIKQMKEQGANVYIIDCIEDFTGLIEFYL